MKTPKLLAAVPILALSASAVIGWSAITRGESADATTKTSTSEQLVPETAAPVDQARIARMDGEIKRIASRLGMSAPMDIESFAGRDPVRDVIDTGTVIDVTLEQVEQALAAANATPDPEDDKRALDLKHRGSYRFYAPDSGIR